MLSFFMSCEISIRIPLRALCFAIKSGCVYRAVVLISAWPKRSWTILKSASTARAGVGSTAMQFVDGVWGCELIEGLDSEGNRVISEVGYTMDNSSKTSALFEANKGVNKRDVDGMNVNTRISSREHTA